MHNQRLLLSYTPPGSHHAAVAKFIRDELHARGERRQWMMDASVRLQRARWFVQVGRSEQFPFGKNTWFPEGTLFCSVDYGTPRPGAGWALRKRYVEANYIFDKNKRLITVACTLDAPTVFWVEQEDRE